MWTEGSQDINEAREKEISGKFFKPALDKGAQMVRHYNTTKSAHRIIRGFVEKHTFALQIQPELEDERKQMVSTAGGEPLGLGEQIRRYQAEREKLRKEMMQALKAKDEETRRELEEAGRVLEGKVNTLKNLEQELSRRYQAELEGLREALMQALKEKDEGLTRILEEKAGKLGGEGKMAVNYVAENEGMEAKMKETDREAKQEREQDHVTIPIYK